MSADSSRAGASTDFGETLPAPVRPPVQRFGKYEVIGELGEGGMGRVYKAVDTELGRIVAVKVLRSSDPFECSRFRGEAEMIAALDHPNIVKVFDIATTPDARPYIVLEYCEGGSLDRELGGQPIEPRRAAEMAETLARAVQVAHERGVIHRDLKPANVLRGKDKILKLTDFGLAKELEVSSGMTPSGAVMGTPSYMSPEQAEGKTKQLGPATDVYGLGAILYEMITGRPPFRGVNMVDTLEQVRWAEPAPPSRLVPRLHRDLATICLKCLQKTPARRYQTASELADDLRRWLNGETITARRAPTWERLVRQVRRRPWEAATVVAIVLLAALVIGVLVVNSERQREKRAEADRLALKEQAAEELSRAERSSAAKLAAEQEEHAERLRKRGAKSRTALDAIRKEVTDGGLKGKPGLHELHAVLADYYLQHIDEALADGKADRPELAKLANQTGELAYQSGLLDKAELLFGRARALYAELTAGDPAHRPALGDAMVKVARVLFDRNRDADALAACAEAEGLWREQRAADRDRAGRDHTTLQLAELEHLRGELFRRRSDAVGARDSFTAAIDYRKEVAERFRALTVEKFRADPPDQRARAVRYLRELGRGYGYRGDEFLRLGAVADADRDYWDSHEIRQHVFDLLSDPKAPEKTPDERAELEKAKFQLARSWMNLAGFQARQRAYTTAKQNATKAVELSKQLAAESPNNAQYRIDLTANLTEVAEYILLERRDGADDRQTALTLLQRAVEEAEKTNAVERLRNFRAGETLADALALRAEALAAVATDRKAAADDADRALRFFDDARKRYPDNVEYRFQRATLLALGAELSGAAPDDPRWKDALDELEGAFKGRYRGRHRDDIKSRRCFQKLASDPRFKEIFNNLSD